MSRFYETVGRVTVLLVCVAFLGGWSYYGRNTGTDDYYFERKQYEDLDQVFKFTIIRDRAEWNRLLNKYHGRKLNKKKLRAWTVLERDVTEDGDFNDAISCHVFMRDPEWVWEPEVLGHEIAHCLWGEWHTIQK